jgi:hypothetical protein
MEKLVISFTWTSVTRNDDNPGMRESFAALKMSSKANNTPLMPQNCWKNITVRAIKNGL